MGTTYFDLMAAIGFTTSSFALKVSQKYPCVHTLRGPLVGGPPLFLSLPASLELADSPLPLECSLSETCIFRSVHLSFA